MDVKKVDNAREAFLELVRYGLVGACTTVVALGSYFLLTRFLLDPADPVQLQIANVVSWAAGVAFAYVTNRAFVFKSKSDDILREALSFTGSRVATLVLEMAVMFVGVTIAGLPDAYVKIGAQVLVIAGNYILAKLLVFKKRGDAVADGGGAGGGDDESDIQ